MDEECIDRVTECINATVGIYKGKAQKPSPQEVQEMLSVFYQFAIKYDQFISEGEDNVINLTKIEP